MRWLVAVAALAACQSKGREATVGSAAPADGTTVVADADDEPMLIDAEAARPVEPEPPDQGKVLADLGAIPAWQAVIDRAQLLERRKQHGVVYGRIGAGIMMLDPTPPEVVPRDAGVPPPKPIDAGLIASPFVWLVDDTEGNGALGIRVELGTLAGKAKEGDRVAIGGAWALDAERHWFWKADSVEAVPPAPSDLKDALAKEPGHAIVNGDLPSGARTLTVGRDNDAVYFQIVGPAPQRDGDGWAVADELGDDVYALMALPGERATYGGQDMRGPDERWQLKRGQTYWVRIGKIRTHGADKPKTMVARTAPVRVL